MDLSPWRGTRKRSATRRWIETAGNSWGKFRRWKCPTRNSNERHGADRRCREAPRILVAESAEARPLSAAVQGADGDGPGDAGDRRSGGVAAAAGHRHNDRLAVRLA